MPWRQRQEGAGHRQTESGNNYAWLVVTLDLLSNILLDENGFRANGNHLCNLCNFTDTLYMSVRMYYIKLLPQVFKTDKGIQIFFYQCWISLPLILLHALLYMSFLDMLGSLALWSSVCCSTTLVQNEIQYSLVTVLVCWCSLSYCNWFNLLSVLWRTF